MKFKEGDRVRVLRLNDEDVNFYATLYKVNEKTPPNLIDCTDEKHEYDGVFLPRDEEYGKDKTDYYVLAEDEEDTEAPVVQRVEDIKRYMMDAEEYIESAFKAAEKSKYDFNQSQEQNKKVELDNHYIIEVKKGLYVEEVGSHSHFKFTKDITKANIYPIKQSIFRHAELLDGRILNLKRYVEV